MKTAADVALFSRADVLSRQHFPSMLMLALTAGAVNAGALAVSDRFVTHVTGTVTRIGIDAGQWLLMLDYAIVLAAFILGAMASVLAIQARALRGRAPLHFAPLVAAAVILLGVAGVGAAGILGPIGAQAESTANFVFLSVLAFAMGLLNAGVASSTALAVRVTHMTGPATDFGVSLATAWLCDGEDRRAALQMAGLRLGKLVSFILGAALMLPVVGTLGYLAFAAPAAVLLAVAVRSFMPAAAGARVAAERAPVLSRS
jgi:uncharacterized membrane protein YoaK (UPF0700 family)